MSIDLRVRAGSVNEGEYSGSGIAHLVEHMIFKGTSRRQPAQIEKEIRSLGGIMNGGVTYDYASYTITVPSEHLAKALDGLSDSICNSIMDGRELAREKGVILKEIRLHRDDPAKFISQLLWSTVFISHPYRNPVIGYESLFVRLTQQDVLNFYKRMYIPNNMVIAIAGDVGTDEALASVKRYFENVPRKSLEERPMASEKPQTSKRGLSMERDLEMAYFALGYRSVDVYHPDMYALDVLAAVLGQGESSRLNTAVYRKKQLVYSIASWNYTPKDPGIFIVSGVTDPGKLDSALAAVSDEIKSLKEGMIDDSELQRAKSIITKAYVYSLETTEGQAEDLASNEITTGDPSYMRTYVEKIMAVTKDDIRKTAAAYLKDESLSVATLAHAAPVATPQTKTERATDRKIEKVTLPNGLRLLLMEDHATPTVSMFACSLGGLLAEAQATAGISNLTTRMMTLGTQKRSEADIASLSESLGAPLNSFSGYNSMGIALDAMSKDLDKVLDLFEDVLLNPSFPEDVLAREKNTVIAVINSVDDDIFDLGTKTFKETLFRSHPYRFQEIGTVDTVEDLKREDLEQFYRKYFVPSNMVVAVYGDINAASVRERLSNGLSVIDKKDAPGFNKVKEPPQKEIREKGVSLDKEQSLVILGFQGTTLANNDRYVLQIITAAISGVSGSLSMFFREKLGIAYAVGAYSVPAIDPGFIALYVSTTEDQIDTGTSGLLNQIITLNKKGLAPEIIESTKQELIGNHLIALQTNSDMAHQTALDELYGLGFDDYTRYDQTIRSITSDGIVAVSRKYLKPEAYTMTVITGETRFE